MCSLCFCRIPVAPVYVGKSFGYWYLHKHTPQEISWDVSCKLNKVAAEIVITTFNDFACQFACNYSSVRLEKNYHPNQVLKSIKQNICDGKWHYFTLDNCEYKSLLK